MASSADAGMHAACAVPTSCLMFPYDVTYAVAQRMPHATFQSGPGIKQHRVCSMPMHHVTRTTRHAPCTMCQAPCIHQVCPIISASG